MCAMALAELIIVPELCELANRGGVETSEEKQAVYSIDLRRLDRCFALLFAVAVAADTGSQVSYTGRCLS